LQVIFIPDESAEVTKSHQCLKYMQPFLHLSAAGCLNTEKLEGISIGARSLGLAS
jgi:hypothetical protein